MTTSQKLIVAASELLQVKGYFGTGITEVLKQAGVPKGSMYHHFPNGKDQLVVESLWYSTYEMLGSFKGVMKGKPNGLLGLCGIIDLLSKDLVESGYSRACWIATVNLEVGGDQPEIQQACQNIYHYWLKSLEDYLIYKKEDNPKEKARFFLTLLEGGFILAKASKDVAYMNKIKEDLKLIFN